jgi:hypothetical protein
MKRIKQKDGDRPAFVLSKDISLEQVLDDTCDRLWEKKVRYSLRRLQEMEDALGKMEQELNEKFLFEAGPDTQEPALRRGSFRANL